MQKTYQSKIDLWLIALFMICAIAPFISIIMDKGYTTANICKGIVLGIISVSPFLFLSPVSYTIDDTSLLIRCGFLVKRKIDIMKINEITTSHNLASAPAMSIDRLKISFNGDAVYISPRNKEDFIEVIKKINTEIKTDKCQK